MAEPTVSVIMNCYNGEKYLREAIDSIYAQTFSDWEIIFWDNASTDRSPEIAAKYDDRLHYFQGRQTIPLYAARNRALEQARGKYIAFLDCDDLWLPKKLEKQVRLFQEEQKVGLVYSNVQFLDNQGQIREWYRHKAPSGMLFRQLLRHYHLILPTVIITRCALESLDSWFDESLHVCGDLDLFLRIAHEWPVNYLPEVTARYREHGDNTTLTRPELYITESEYVIKKFSQLYKGFRKDYELEIIAFMARVHKGFVLKAWQCGKNETARRLALQHLTSIRSMVLLYFLSFFPFRLFNYLRQSRLFSWR